MTVQSPDTFERAVIGCLVTLPPDDARSLALSLSPDLFHHPRNRHAFTTLRGPATMGTPYGHQTAIAAIKQSPGTLEHFGATEGAVEAMMEGCTEACDPFQSWEQYASQLKLSHTRRVLSGAFDEAAMEAASAGSVGEASTLALSKVIEAANLLRPVSDQDQHNIMSVAMRYQAAYQDKDTVIPFPQEHLNTIGGLRPGEICILAAFTAHRKSWIAIDWTLEWAKLGNRVRFFTLEMPASQVLERMIAMEFNVAHENLICRRIELPHVQRWLGQISDNPIEIVQGVTSAQDVMASAYSPEGKPDVVVIDHLQLLQFGGTPELRRISIDDVLSALKGWAVDNQIAVVIVSQFRRPILLKDQKLPRPDIYMLKESGGIEQIADYIIFTHESKTQKSSHFGDSIVEGPSEIELWVAKQRNGEPNPAQVMTFRNYRMR